MSNRQPSSKVQIYFSDFFGVAPDTLTEYGAFDISLIADMPLFVDPFLLFNSDKPEYTALHEGIIRYLKFLLMKSQNQALDPGLIHAWYRFKEVKQTWLGYSRTGNRGSGLGEAFAHQLHSNLSSIFRDFGEETITKGSHLEKLCLVAPGVGKDNISDFAVCLIKEYLLTYTQSFAVKHLTAKQIWTGSIERARFNYKTQSWEARAYHLPRFQNSYVLLTPMDILTRENTWISRKDFLANFDSLAMSLPNEALRAQLNNYLRERLIYPQDATNEEKRRLHDNVVEQAVRAFPETIEYYIRNREESGEQAVAASSDQVDFVVETFVQRVREFVGGALGRSGFYRQPYDSFEAAMKRLLFMKSVIENQDGYRIFYHDGKPLQRESDLQLMFKLTWFGTEFDVNAEVNNGRGPVDFKVSLGSSDKSLVEFKLAKNKKLKQNLQNQLAIYQRANDTNRSIWAIFYFSDSELNRVRQILADLGLSGSEKIVLIDCRDDKPSASHA